MGTHDEETGPNLGQRMMVRFLEVKQSLAKNFGFHDIMVCEDWTKCTPLLEHGDKIRSSFGSIMTDRGGSLITEPRNLVRHYRGLGIKACCEDPAAACTC